MLLSSHFVTWHDWALELASQLSAPIRPWPVDYWYLRHESRRFLYGDHVEYVDGCADVTSRRKRCWFAATPEYQNSDSLEETGNSDLGACLVDAARSLVIFEVNYWNEASLLIRKHWRRNNNEWMNDYGKYIKKKGVWMSRRTKRNGSPADSLLSMFWRLMDGGRGGRGGGRMKVPLRENRRRVKMKLVGASRGRQGFTQ